MAFEYQMLWLMTLIFLFAWFPASMAKLKSFGGKWVASSREPLQGKELLPWGARAERAHNNLKDNFPGFIVAIVLLGLTQHFDDSTAIAAGIFVAARVLHFLFYVTEFNLGRALAYMTGLGANIFLLVKIL